MKTHELKAGGKDVDVTAANRREYVDRYVHWVLDESIAKQFEEFKVHFIIPLHIIYSTMCRGHSSHHSLTYHMVDHV